MGNPNFSWAVRKMGSMPNYRRIEENHGKAT